MGLSNLSSASMRPLTAQNPFTGKKLHALLASDL